MRPSTAMRGSAKSFTSTWTRSSRPSSSATTRTCAAGPWPSAARASGAWWRRLRTRPRRFGVRSAMPSVTARRKCPDLIFVKPRFEVYKAVSVQIRAIFADYTPLIEPLVPRRGLPRRDREPEGDGVGDRDRRGDPGDDPGRDGPDRLGGGVLQQVPGQAGLRPEQARRPVRHHAHAWDRPSSRRCRSGAFTGSGRRPRPRWQRLGIRTGADLKANRCLLLERHFGKAGPVLLLRSRAASTTVRSGPTASESRSGPRIRSRRDLISSTTCRRELQPILDKVWRWCESTRRSRPHRDAEGQVHRLRADHAQPILAVGNRQPGHASARRLRASGAPVARVQGRASPWCHGLVARA